MIDNRFYMMDNPDRRLDILRGVVKENIDDQIKTSDVKEEKREDIVEKKIQFECRVCGLCEMCQYYGTSPPFVRKGLEFSEPCYVMLDPFSPYNPKRANNFLVLGADCSGCSATVCVDCSIFFTKTFCVECAQFNINEFPLDVQNRIVKIGEGKPSR